MHELLTTALLLHAFFLVIFGALLYFDPEMPRSKKWSYLLGAALVPLLGPLVAGGFFAKRPPAERRPGDSIDEAPPPPTGWDH